MRGATVAAALSVLVVALMLFPHQVAGQAVFGTISGTVTDPSGAVLADATVKVLNLNTNITTTLRTNSAGVYNASSLNPGTYTIQAEARGFKRAVAKEVVLEVNANVRIDLKLQVGQASDSIEVTGEAPLLQTQQSSLSQSVNQRQLEQLPMTGGAGRSVYSLIPLSAGVSQQVGAGGYDNDNLRINGDRPRSDDYQVDGATITAPVWGGQGISPSVDSIQEFRVEANTMSAEYGKTSGGVIIAVTKTGTNALHGSAYGYLRNQKLDAKNYFERSTDPKNPYTYSEFGGSIGGPIIKNKLFFFTDYQGVRNHGSTPAIGNTVPDSAFRSGNLGALCTSGFDGAGICRDRDNDGNIPTGHQVYLPGTFGTANPVPVPYNRITAISPISQKILAILPTSSIASAPGTNLYDYSSPFSNPVNRFNPRIDYSLSQSDHIFGAFHWERYSSLGYTLIVGPAGEQLHPSTNKVITAGWTHTFSQSMLNDFRFGYLSLDENRGAIGAGNYSPADFGISGIPNCLSSVPNTAGGTKCGLPSFSITGFSGIANDGTNFQKQSTFSFSDTITKTIGRHVIKAGVDFRRYAIGNYQPNEVNGDFSFTGSQTGVGFADFLFGVISSNGDVQVQNAMLESRAWAHAYFVQDDFRITPKLTLNLGLRYQLDFSFHELHNGLAFFNPYTAAWEQFGVNAPSTTFDTSKKEFGPRIGFAWNPKGGFVVRGGYGITYPGTLGHGRAGDGQPGPNLLSRTNFDAGTNWGQLPAVVSPDPQSITAPIPVNSNVSWSFWAPRRQTPTYVQLWNLTVEQQLGKNTTASIGYIGSHGTHLPVNYGHNICQQSPQSAAQNGWNATTSPYCSAAAAQAAGLGNLVVNPGWWGLSSSIYKALQVKVDHRFSHGFSLLANFTWSSLMDDSSSDWGGFGALDGYGQDFYSRKRTVSAGDIPRRLTLAPIVELPFGHGKKWLNSGVASQVLGGWRVSTIYTISDGYPLGMQDSCTGYCNVAHTLNTFPMLVGDPLPSGFHQSVNQWFNIAAFDWSGTFPSSNLFNLNSSWTGPMDPNKAFGNAPRFFSNLRSTIVNNLDFSLQKDFKIPVTEQTRLKFQMDLFNLPNHPQFTAPDVSSDVNFGRITSTALNNRTIQLGLHFYF